MYNYIKYFLKEKTMKHIISIVVRNNSGVLARVSSLFSRRGFNIDSLSVSATDDPKISRITAVANGDEKELEQVVKQTSKLFETINVTALKEENSVCRELLLVKVLRAEGDFFNSNIVKICDHYGAFIIDITQNSMIMELTGTSTKLDEFMLKLQSNKDNGGYKITKVCRTGITALERGI